MAFVVDPAGLPREAEGEEPATAAGAGPPQDGGDSSPAFVIVTEPEPGLRRPPAARRRRPAATVIVTSLVLGVGAFLIVRSRSHPAPEAPSREPVARAADGDVAGAAALGLLAQAGVVPASATDPASKTDTVGPTAQSRPKDWVVTDPDGDCEVIAGASDVAFDVPGVFHDLTGRSGIAPVSGKRNAPKATRPVAGDFAIEGAVSGDFRPDGKATGPGAPYHGAGLLLWVNTDNFIRLERATVIRDGAVSEFINFVFCRNGTVEQIESGSLPSGKVVLLLERRGDEVRASARGDGETTFLEPYAAAWPRDVRVGVVAVNSSETPLKCRVEGLKVTASATSPGGPSEPGLASRLADRLAGAMRDSASASPIPVDPSQLPAPPATRPLTTAEIVERCEASVALIRGKSSSGTGFVVLPWLVATNAHVIEDEPLESLEIRFPSATGRDREPQAVELVYEDRRRDLALLKVAHTPPPLRVARDFRYVKGEDVVVIGNPGVGGGELTLENAVSRGVLSVKVVLDGQAFYQLGIAINPGNSGGPVFDALGRVIGVATLKTTKQEALAFCVPSLDLAQAIDGLNGNSSAVRSSHQARRTLKFLACSGALSAAVLDLHLACLSRGMQAGDKTLVDARQELTKLEGTLFDGLGASAQRLIREDRPATDIREDVRRLASNREEFRSLIQAASRGEFDPSGARASSLKRSFRETLARAALRVDLQVPEGILSLLGDANPFDQPGGSSPVVPSQPGLPGFRERFGIGSRVGPIGPRSPFPSSPFAAPRRMPGGLRGRLR